MGSKAAIAFLLLLGLTNGSVDVNMTGAWRENVGWQLTCTWTLDSRPLQSVRLYKDDVQFMIFRPEKQGQNHFFKTDTHDGRIAVDCHDVGRMGRCGVALELLTPPVFDAKYKCEVSEEGPRFDMQQAEYTVEVFVPPLYPQLEVSTVDNLTNVNCTSAGIPAPRLMWRIGEQRIPENFSNRRWDESKLWYSWSVVSIPRPHESLVLTCTVLSARAGNAFESQSVEVVINSAGRFSGEKAVILVIFSLVSLLR